MKEIIISDRADYKVVQFLAKKYGVSINVDVFSNTELYENHTKTVNNVVETYKDVRIVSMHGPYRDLCFGSSDVLIKRATAERFETAYEIAKKIRCDGIVLHHGYIPGTSSPRKWLERSNVFWKEFFNNKSNDISIYLENQFEHTPDLIIDVVSAVNNHKLGICFDVGHANCNSKLSVIKWIEQLKDKIKFVHLHNNDGTKDQHSNFYEGIIDFKEVCQALENYAPDSIWEIENNSPRDTEKSLQWLIENGYLKI